MPRPRSSTFYLPLAPADAPLSLKAKLSVLPPSAANALLAPRHSPATTTTATAAINGPSTHTPFPPLDCSQKPGVKEDECARLERVLGLDSSSHVAAVNSRRTGRRHTDAPLPQLASSLATNPFALCLSTPNTSTSTPSIPRDLVSSTEDAQRQPDLSLDPRPTDIPSQHLVQPAASISSAAGNGTSTLGTAATTSPRIGASEMDLFASACAFGTANLSPSTVQQEAIECVSSTILAPTKPALTVPVETPRLSMVPCGLAKIWACRTRYPSKLCSSVTADEISTSPPHRQFVLPHQLALPPSIASCGSLHPMDARHLLPRHLRLSFPPPPPPCPAAAVTAAAPTTAVADLCGPCHDGISPAQLSTAVADFSTHSPADEAAVSPGGAEVAISAQMEDIVRDVSSDPVMHTQLVYNNHNGTESPVRITLTPPGPALSTTISQPKTPSTPPPRQRYRLAPLYLHKVLRRSLGASAWARAETVRLARSVEQACGFSLVSHASTMQSSSSTIGRHTQWDDIVRSGFSLPPVNANNQLGSSLVWSGYEDVYIPGEGDQLNNGAAFSGQLSAGGANVWIQNVFDSAECAWDIDLEDEEDADADMDMDLESEEFDESEDSTRSSHFVRESAPEPEERSPVVVVEPISPHTPVEQHSHHGSSSSYTSVGLGLAVVKPDVEDTRSPSPDGYGGYAAVGKFTWGSEWPASPTIARPPTGIGRQWSSSVDKSLWRMDEDEPPATPYHPVLSPSASSSSSSSASTSSGLLAPFSHDEEENIFRYSPLQDDETYSPLQEEDVFRYSPSRPDDMDLDLDVPQDPHAPGDYVYDERLLLATSPSTDTIPISLSPSFPPPPLIGTKISSCSESEDESDASGAAAEREDEFYDASSPTAGVFVIPPSPLTKTSFGQPSPLAISFGYSSPTVAGPSTPTSMSRFAQQQQQSPLMDDPPRRSLERIRSSRRSMERIGPAKRSMEWIKPTGRNEHSPAPYEPSSPTLVAPRPRRASRALENVFSRQSPVFKTSALPASPTSLVSPPSSTLLLPTSPSSSLSYLPTSPTLSASSPPLSSPVAQTSRAAWTFGSLKSALSNSVSHLVELARSRSPSPLPWLIRGSGISASSANSHATTSTPLTLSGAAAALAASSQATLVNEAHESSSSSSSHTREPSSEELEAERSSCVTPTPTSSRPRRASSTTITKVDAVASVVAVPQVQLETTAGEVVVGTSPPPKRTLSTSSLSSMESEPESESGSSGGVFSRSPSPEPDSRTWDSSYSLTPRSRPISADAKAAVSHGGRLSPMMIPGSWDPNELLWDDEDVANDQLRI